MSILNIFGRQRIGPEVKILSPGERMNQRVLCPHCEKELDGGHDPIACSKRGVSRRVFFGLFGASAAALAMRAEGHPLPFAKVQVRAYAGDMFEVETLNPFTLAWGSAKTRAGNPFKADDGTIAEGGILEFHGQDVARPDKWLRVHRGLSEMEVLGLVDKVTGLPVKYKIVRSGDADKLESAAQKRVMLDHAAAARAMNRDLGGLRDEAVRRVHQQMIRDEKLRAKTAHAIQDKFGSYRRHPSVDRLAWGRSLPRPKGTLPA